MKAQNFAGLRPIHLYMPGDLLLEQERLAASGPVVLNVLGGGAPVPEPPAQSIFDILKPKTDDYPALTKTLQVLKFEPEDVVNYHEILGSVINMATGLVWGVGAVLTVAARCKTWNVGPRLFRSRRLAKSHYGVTLWGTFFFADYAPDACRLRCVQQVLYVALVLSRQSDQWLVGNVTNRVGCGSGWCGAVAVQGGTSGDIIGPRGVPKYV